MILSPELTFEEISKTALANLADNVCKQLPDCDLELFDQRGKPWQRGNKNLNKFEVKEPGQKKPFLVVNATSASLFPSRAQSDNFTKGLAEIQEGTSRKAPDPYLAMAALVVFLTAFFGFLLPEIAGHYRHSQLVAPMIGAVLALLATLAVMGILATTKPGSGHVNWALIFGIPGFITLSPLSVLCVPAALFLRRRHGALLLRQHLGT